MEPQNVADDNIKRGDHSIREDRVKSSSVSSVGSGSSDFSFEDTYQLDINEHDYSSNNAQETPGSTSILETPPVQIMERPTDPSAYRIPSYVFNRNKLSNPNPDWSTASNDSLFSIHTGNMSFTKDQFSWLMKSGELGTHTPGDIRKSGELPPPSPIIVAKSVDKMPRIPPNMGKSGEQIIANHFNASSVSPPVDNRPAHIEAISSPKVNGGVVGLDATKNTEKYDPKPETQVKTQGRSSTSDEVPHSAGVSPHRSDASGQSLSFAFPVLAEIDREKSVNSGQSRAEHRSRSLDTDQEGSKTSISAPAAASSSGSWFSCLSCSSCS